MNPRSHAHVATLALLAGMALIAAPCAAQESEAPRTRAAEAPTPPPPMVSKGVYLVREFRNPTLAAAASLVLPGGGQVYNDDLPKFLGTLAGLGSSVALYMLVPDRTSQMIAVAGFGLTWAWSVGDAYLSAAVFNRLLEQEAQY
ncbi:MAG: hypothetical protein FJZ00_06180 [Candidatus Sericytochromatia bacterium]|uniref:DUF5683 domain-containing protein n=1 Tax=Candidatus Tanganyikabacteria bacterium TaxID=2961651 RepID=A0A937X2G5_9BACT|nr:hypothetical protein [Candidatus Tanganyikabacteria bacterium]